jgi:4-hydroxy-tetrahydrodipicolinate synthase
VVRVHQAATEVEALALEQALRAAGLRVWLRSRQVPGYADIIASASGVWGDLLVAPEDADRARDVVSGYLAALSPQEGSAVRRFAGIIPPLVTLFDRQGAVDEEAMRRHVERLVAAGVHGVLALGTTGEVMHLTPEERRRVAALVVDQVRGRVPVLVGCAGTATDEVVAYARHAREIGATAALVIVPYYWTLTDAALEAHFAAVARAVDLPVLIYNFPAVSGRNVPPALVARLAGAHRNIMGIKETLDSVAHIAQVLAQVRPQRPDFCVLCGFEFHLLNTLLLGGDGAIPGMANVAPETAIAVYDAVRRGELAYAAELVRQRLEFPGLYELGAPFFVVVKEAMALAGQIDHAMVRPPAVPLGDEARARLHTLLGRLGIL